MEYGHLDVVAQWQDLIDKMNEDEACDFCWRFFAPYTQIKANVIRDDGSCCVFVILTRESANAFGTNLAYNRVKGMYENIEHYENYTIDFVIASKEGIDNYNELAGDGEDIPGAFSFGFSEGFDIGDDGQTRHIEQSRHATIFEPLRKCITMRLIDDLCNYAPVTSWNGRYIYDHQDEIYYGIRLNITQIKRI